MYLSALIGQLTESMSAPSRQRQRTGQPGRGLPASLGGLSDHQLRDIGYVRERTIAPHRHILWM